jgi:hypothetical protein
MPGIESDYSGDEGKGFKSDATDRSSFKLPIPIGVAYGDQPTQFGTHLSSDPDLLRGAPQFPVDDFRNEEESSQ